MTPAADFYHLLHPLTVSYLFILLLSLLQMSAEDDPEEVGPAESTTRLCTSSIDCHLAAGEVCWWFYSGCPVGECMCDPSAAYRDRQGRCRRTKLGKEMCTQYDKCPKDMTCSGGRCLCITGTMTPDRAFCLGSRERLLGQTCSSRSGLYSHTCYQKSTLGYSPTEVTCNSFGVCACRDGYKERGSSCIRWTIGEHGCLKNYQCQGGALCIDGFCRCPTGYEPGAGNSKCVRQGATFDLVKGHLCDEINESRYCAKDYVCHRCAGQHNYTCVRFLETQHRRYVSAGVHADVTSVLIILPVLHVTLIVVSASIWKNR